MAQFLHKPSTSSVQSNKCIFFRYGFSYFDEDPNSESGEKQKEKSKKSRLLYNTTDNAEDLDDDTSIEKGNGNLLTQFFHHCPKKLIK